MPLTVEVGHHRQVAPGSGSSWRPAGRPRRQRRRPRRASRRRGRVTDTAPSGSPTAWSSGGASSMARAAVLALSTSGWSKGLIPRSRPATAVATSQSMSWAPRVPVTRRSRRRLVRRSRVGSASPTRWATVTSAAGRLTSGESVPSTTTGRTPVPSLPVLSAMSCSAQAGKPVDAGALVDQDQLVAQRLGPGHRRAEAEARVRLVVGGQQVGDRLGLVEQALDVDTGQRAGHQAEGGQRGVATADVGVGVDDAVPGRSALLLQRAARVGHDDDAVGRGRARPRRRRARRRAAGSRSPPSSRTSRRPRRRCGQVIGQRPRGPGRGGWSRAPPGRRRRSAQMTSGASEEPPIPQSTTRSRPLAAQLLAQRGDLADQRAGRTGGGRPTTAGRTPRPRPRDPTGWRPRAKSRLANYSSTRAGDVLGRRPRRRRPGPTISSAVGHRLRRLHLALDGLDELVPGGDELVDALLLELGDDVVVVDADCGQIGPSRRGRRRSCRARCHRAPRRGRRRRRASSPASC